MSKVKLPKDVAEAIEQAWEVGEVNRHFVRHLYLTNWQRMRGDHSEELVDTLADYAKEYPMEYMSALVNGYEVEYTPKQQVRAYYEGLKQSEDLLESIGSSGSQFRQGWMSVEETLRILNIKIEGINK